MTAESCPACRAQLRADASFCSQCGAEVRPPCPACGAAPRLLATMLDPQTAPTPWCAACEALLDACELCGRWLLPGTGACPDPQCGARVLPVCAQHTGRRWDGRGTTVGWVWPPEWDRNHPQFRMPFAEEWPCAEPVHTVFAAHGGLYVWAGTNLLMPDVTAGWMRVDEAGNTVSAPVPSPDGIIAGAKWQCPLGATGTPTDGVPFKERTSVAAACAVLSTERSFVQVGLRHRGDLYPLGGGLPVAQAAGPRFWVGWSRQSGSAEVRLARVLPTGDLSTPEVIKLPSAAAPGAHSEIVLRDRAAFWPAADGSVWSIEGDSGAATQLSGASEGFAWVWAVADGHRVARERRGQVFLQLSARDDGLTDHGVPVGAGPLRGVFDHPDLLVVAADRLIAFEPGSGERVCEALRPPGRWVDGALASAPDGEPRFLALTVEGGFATLTAVRMSSGAQDLLWRQSGVEPRALLAVGDTIYVAHTQGVVRLRR